jgi:hypothetical protein
MVGEAACSEIGGKIDPDAAETLPLSLSKKHFEIALRYHGLDCAFPSILQPKPEWPTV